ncbi:hypothetical protein [Oricola indica]|uniref:hypothetical protein n=1 Tax=Oricola indica TaxID=2872591 RepID=UPI003CCBC0D6
MSAITVSDDEQYDIRKGLPVLAFRLFVAFGILALLSVAILIAGKLYGRSLVHAGHTLSTQRFEVVIGNDAISVPANMIRIRDQRRAGLAKRLDLYIHWPTMSGFNDGLARAFNDIDPETNSIVFVSLTPRITSTDMAGRFDTVYRNVMDGPVTDLGNGLKRALLAREHGYIEEFIVFSEADPETGRRFVARCQKADATAQTIVAPCDTDIQIGETLNAELRFPMRLLDDWSRMNAALPEFLAGLLKAARS